MIMDTCVFCSKSLFDGQHELRTVVGQSVHVKCRQEYTNPLIIQSYRKRTANDIEAVDKHVLGSS